MKGDAMSEQDGSTKLYQVPELTLTDWARLVDLMETGIRLQDWFRDVRDAIAAIMGVDYDYSLPPK